MRIDYMMLFRWVSICFISFFIGFEVHRLSVKESVPNFIKAVQSAQYVVDTDKGDGVFLNGLRRKMPMKCMSSLLNAETRIILQTFMHV